MTSDFPMWRRHETGPLVKAYNNFAVVLVVIAFVLTFLLFGSQSSLLVSLAPIFVAAVFLGFIFLKDVRPELKRSSDAKVGRGSGLTEEGTAGQAGDHPDLPMNKAIGRERILHSRVVGILFLATWLAWLLSFILFLEANTAMWGMRATTAAMREVITSSEPMLRLSVIFLASAIIMTACAEWRKPDFPLYSLEGLWKSSLDMLWFDRFCMYSLLAEFVLFVAGLNGVVTGCLAPCSAPGWGVLFLLSALMLPLEIAAVDIAALFVLLRRSRTEKWGVPVSFYVATLFWLFVGALAFYAFWAVISNP